jgi:pimeloyl-ACP methyl ester carboxylesterase
MYTVRSNHSLTAAIAEKLSPKQEPADEAFAIAAVLPEPGTPSVPAQPIAVVGIHGISPIQRYAFQDQLAGGLLSYLNANETATGSKRVWRPMAYWPHVGKKPGDPQLKPTALRLYRDDESNPEEPTTQVYDVYEGYWSPLSKGKTNIVALLQWLLRCTFLATSSTARIPATCKKLCWDAGYLMAALSLGLGSVIAAFVVGVFAWHQFTVIFIPIATTVSTSATSYVLSFSATAANPLSALTSLPFIAFIQLLITVVIGYLLVQLVVVLIAWRQTSIRSNELLDDARKQGRFKRDTIAANKFQRTATIVFSIIVLLLIVVDAVLLRGFGFNDWGKAGLYGFFVVAAIAFIQFARFVADFVVEDVLGDIQVYTTHDCNAEFYAIRDAILTTVTSALLGPLNAVNPHKSAVHAKECLYKSIHVIGHSLGSTIALDVLIRLRQLVQEAAVDRDAWGRVRSLTTFGTSLEKTRFFFDVRQPTVSAAEDQWANDIYGRFFSMDRRVLRTADNTKGVYWSNHWYLRDIVANRIVSYWSDVHAGAKDSTFRPGQLAHPICRNYKMRPNKPFYAWVHSEYLADPVFWRHFGPVVTG